MERHREPHLVVLALPTRQRDRGGFEADERVPAPELLGVHAMAALHLAVLIGAPRLDIPMPDAAPLDGEEEGEGELRAVVEYEGMRRNEATSPPRMRYPFSRLPRHKEGSTCLTI